MAIDKSTARKIISEGMDNIFIELKKHGYKSSPGDPVFDTL